HVFDAASGAEVARLDHSGQIQAAAFSPATNSDFLLAVTVSGNEARVWEVAPSTDKLVQMAKRRMPRCLTQTQRAQYCLPAAPPLWCITGAGLEEEEDPARWEPKWPYQSDEWRNWLAARRRGEQPPVPSNY